MTPWMVKWWSPAISNIVTSRLWVVHADSDDLTQFIERGLAFWTPARLACNRRNSLLGNANRLQAGGDVVPQAASRLAGGRRWFLCLEAHEPSAAGAFPPTALSEEQAVNYAGARVHVMSPEPKSAIVRMLK